MTFFTKLSLLAFLMFETSLTMVHAATSIDCNHDSKTLKCVDYIRNYDADTITVSIKNIHPLLGEKVGVRVRGLDAPEIKGKLPCEKEVARYAKNLIENLLSRAKRIDLENVDRDKYFRILADVKVDSADLKSLLLKNNLAYAYNGGTKEKINWCKRFPAAANK